MSLGAGLRSLGLIFTASGMGWVGMLERSPTDLALASLNCGVLLVTLVHEICTAIREGHPR